MKIIFNKKIIKIILIIAVILFLGGWGYKIFFNKKENGLKLEKVERGAISQEVSETGTIKPTEEINLSFKTAGRLAKINVKIGDAVEKGTELASLDTAQLFNQLNKAEASLAVAKIQYEKTSQNAKMAAEQNLNDAYEDALNTLNDAYLKMFNAFKMIASLTDNYFSLTDQEGIKVGDSKNNISANLDALNSSLEAAKTSLNHSDIDTAIITANTSLTNTAEGLKTIREICDTGVYYSKISSSDKSSIDNHRSYILTALTNVNNSRQTIVSAAINLQKAKDDISYYEAKVKEAEEEINYYQQQIWDAKLRAPLKGIITKVNKKVGEMVQTGETPISLISLNPLQVKVDIYEEDIVKIQKGNPVDIKVVAFPNEILKGKVIAIDPAEKIIEGVVYYEVTIAFNEEKEDLTGSLMSQNLWERIKPGMTTDVVIKTATKENVLTIPKEAIRENRKTTVLVLKNGKLEEREVQVGLEGNNGRIEIIAGLSEGEEVVVK